MHTLADGTIVYNCLICHDSGWVHPVKEDFKPDFSKVVPCRCRRGKPAENQSLFATGKEGEN